MYIAIILLPLLGSISSGFFGRKIGVSGSQLITTTCIVLITIFSVVSFFEVGFNNISVTIKMFKWIDSESLNAFWAFNFDSLTVSMLIPVLVVSSLVHFYSVGYMSHDPHNQRFFSYLSLFTFMMVVLVTANNFLLMFVGWEGVGICSYLLVSFWFTRIAANQSSISALLTNRVGDFLLTLGMCVILILFGNVDYSTIFSLAPYISENLVTLVGVCLLIGAMAKSSQIGLHVWLPMAMEGPTPVSALIHAATMVTAGVYLLMRNSPLIEYSSTILMLAIWIGAFTTVFSSLVGLFQQDIKKVIAYSTMSQLGMMVVAVGLSSYNIALFHLINHAFYKALLFLGAGSVIHAVADNQDFRKYGGLRSLLPLTYSVMFIASLSLVAFPFMTGFYSKDLIIESAFGDFSFFSIAVYSIIIIGAMFTTLYSVKVLYVTFITGPNGPQANYKIAHEGDIFMSLPLIILATFSIFFGYVTKDIFIGLGSGFFTDNSLFVHPINEIMVNTEFAVPSFYKLLPFFLTISLAALSFVFYEFIYNFVLSFKLSNITYRIFSFFNQRFYIEMFYNTYITDLLLKSGDQTTKVLDKGSVELVGPFGLEKGLNFLSNTTRKLETGNVANYALHILAGLVIYVTVPILVSSLLIVMLLASLNLNLNLGTKINGATAPVLHSSFFGFYKSKFFTRFCVGLLVSMSITLPLSLFLKPLGLTWFMVFVVGVSSFITCFIVTNIRDLKTQPIRVLFLLSLMAPALYYLKLKLLGNELNLGEIVTVSVAAVYSCTELFMPMAMTMGPEGSISPIKSLSDLISPISMMTGRDNAGSSSSAGNTRSSISAGKARAGSSTGDALRSSTMNVENADSAGPDPGIKEERASPVIKEERASPEMEGQRARNDRMRAGAEDILGGQGDQLFGRTDKPEHMQERERQHLDDLKAIGRHIRSGENAGFNMDRERAHRTMIRDLVRGAVEGENAGRNTEKLWDHAAIAFERFSHNMERRVAGHNTSGQMFGVLQTREGDVYNAERQRELVIETAVAEFDNLPAGQKRSVTVMTNNGWELDVALRINQLRPLSHRPNDLGNPRNYPGFAQCLGPNPSAEDKSTLLSHIALVAWKNHPRIQQMHFRDEQIDLLFDKAKELGHFRDIPASVNPQGRRKVYSNQFNDLPREAFLDIYKAATRRDEGN